MTLKLPLNLQRFLEIARDSPQQNVLRFLNNAVAFLSGQDVKLIDYEVDPFRIDSSEREADFCAQIAHYRAALLEMGFLQNQIDYVTREINLDRFRVPPPFSDVLDRVQNAPRLRTLDGADFRGLQHIILPGPLQLTELQQRIFEHAAAEQPVRGVFVLATGFGKTVLAAHLARSSFSAQSKLLFLVNSLLIKKQAEQAFRKILNVSCVDFDGENYADEQAVFCTFQGATKLPARFTGKITHLIVDEAHHVLAPTFFEVFRRFRDQATQMTAGFTATLTHLTDVDGRLIREAFFGQLYCDLPWTVAKALNLFPDVVYAEVLNPVGYRISAFTGDSAYASLLAQHRAQGNLTRFLREISLNVTMSPAQLAQCLATYFAQFGPRKRTICFMSSVQECDDFAERFNALQDFASCTAVHYCAQPQKVAKALHDFKGSDSASFVIVTVAMATEGFDAPHIDCVLLGRKTQSERVFVQQMGRGLRKSSQKRNVAVLDCVGALRSRWMRLRDEQRDDVIWAQIDAFWPVQSWV